jgi:O-antigen ligase
VIQNPPESLWFGAGAASDFRGSVAGKLLFEQTGVAIKHPHNLFLSVLHYSGIVGACLFFFLLTWVLIRLLGLSGDLGSRIRPFALGLYLLILLLNMSDAHMLVAPPSSEWLFFWLPFAYLIGLAKFFETQKS